MNSVIASINSLLRFLSLDDLKIKVVKIQQQVFCSEEKELTKDDYFSLCKAASTPRFNKIGLIIQTIAGTGIRISELQYITVDAIKKGEVSVCCKGKNRTIFIVRDLQKKLLRYIAEQKITSGYVFISKNGKPLDRSNIWREMKKLCCEAGVNPQKVFPHNLRHLFARVYYNLEKDIAKLADILGHSSINTTRIYIVSTGSEHRTQMFLLPKEHVPLRLVTVIDRAVKLLRQKNEHYFYIQANREKILIPCSRVLYMEKMLRKTELITSDNRIGTYQIPSELIENANTANFVQCHRSFYVNLENIYSIGTSEIALLSGEHLPIGSTYSKHLVEQYENYCACLLNPI